MSSGVSCPVCNKTFSVEIIQQHTNECLDLQLKEEKQVPKKNESKSEDLADDWVLLDDNICSHPQSKIHNIGHRMKQRMKKLKNELSDSGFYEVEPESFSRPVENWKFDALVNNEKLCSSCTDSLSNIEERKKIWRNIVILKSREETVSKHKYLIRKGISYQRRSDVWKSIGGVYYTLSNNPGEFDEAYELVFGKNIPSTLITVPTFTGIMNLQDHFLNEEGNSATKRILCAIASNFVEIDCCPVLVDLVPILLSFLPEKDAYLVCTWMLKISIQNSFFFTCTAKQSASQTLIFSELLKNKNIALFNHLQKLNVSVDYFSKDWFDRLFTGYLPYDSVLRVFDSFLCEGRKILFRVGLAILDSATTILLDCNTTKQLKHTLNSVGSHFGNISPIMKRAFRYFITSRKLNSLQGECDSIVLGSGDIVEPQFQVYYRPKFQNSSIISTEQFEILYSWLPERIKIKDPYRLFLSNEDGFSLREMVVKSYSHYPTVLILQSTNGEIFGAFVTEEWKQDNQIFGTAEMFLFILYPSPDVFKAKPQLNQQYIKVSETELQIGEGKFGVGLSLDDELWKGYSENSATYDNPPLVFSNGEHHTFEVKTVELWGFV